MAAGGILTIGHSTRRLEEFIELLRIYGVTLLADVRTVPRSRYNPQFNRDSLPDALESASIAYMHVGGLGGLRHSGIKDSPNGGWHNASFRSYADYMQTPQFNEALDKLIETAARERVALMCAEALPWRCHRTLIADALLIRGIGVKHILSSTHYREHDLTPWAAVDGLRISYPPEVST